MAGLCRAPLRSSRRRRGQMGLAGPGKRGAIRRGTAVRPGLTPRGRRQAWLQYCRHAVPPGWSGLRARRSRGRTAAFVSAPGGLRAAAAAPPSAGAGAPRLRECPQGLGPTAQAPHRQWSLPRLRVAGRGAAPGKCEPLAEGGGCGGEAESPLLPVSLCCAPAPLAGSPAALSLPLATLLPTAVVPVSFSGLTQLELFAQVVARFPITDLLGPPVFCRAKGILWLFKGPVPLAGTVSLSDSMPCLLLPVPNPWPCRMDCCPSCVMERG